MEQVTQAEWDKTSLMEHGRILTGKYAHWCQEWDYMTVYGTCPEFECCLCYESQGGRAPAKDEK